MRLQTAFGETGRRRSRLPPTRFRYSPRTYRKSGSLSCSRRSLRNDPDEIRPSANRVALIRFSFGRSQYLVYLGFLSLTLCLTNGTMKTHLSAAAAVAVVLLAVFTVWIDRRAKSLETVTLTGVRTPALTGKAAPDFSLPALDGHSVSRPAIAARTCWSPSGPVGAARAALRSPRSIASCRCPQTRFEFRTARHQRRRQSSRRLGLRVQHEHALPLCCSTAA